MWLMARVCVLAFSVSGPEPSFAARWATSDRRLELPEKTMIAFLGIRDAAGDFYAGNAIVSLNRFSYGSSPPSMRRCERLLDRPDREIRGAGLRTRVERQRHGQRSLLTWRIHTQTGGEGLPTPGGREVPSLDDLQRRGRRREY